MDIHESVSLFEASSPPLRATVGSTSFNIFFYVFMVGVSRKQLA